MTSSLLTKNALSTTHLWLFDSVLSLTTWKSWSPSSKKIRVPISTYLTSRLIFTELEGCMKETHHQLGSKLSTEGTRYARILTFLHLTASALQYESKKCSEDGYAEPELDVSSRNSSLSTIRRSFYYLRITSAASVLTGCSLKQWDGLQPTSDEKDSCREVLYWSKRVGEPSRPNIRHIFTNSAWKSTPAFTSWRSRGSTSRRSSGSCYRSSPSLRRNTP